MYMHTNIQHCILKANFNRVSISKLISTFQLSIEKPNPVVMTTANQKKKVTMIISQ